MATGELYLKVAPVNFDATIFDTNDLSTIRGASLILLRAAPALAARLEREAWGQGVVAERLYAGASELVVRFRVELPRQQAVEARGQPNGIKKQVWKDTIEALVARVANNAQIGEVARANYETAIPNPESRENFDVARLETHIRAAWQRNNPPVDPVQGLQERVGDWLVARLKAGPLAHFTFSYAFCHAVDGRPNLNEVLARLDTELRRRQLRQLTLSLPPKVTDIREHKKAFCALTLGRRPADPELEDAKGPISTSVSRRRRDGRVMRQKFYLWQIAHAYDAAVDFGEGAHTGLGERLRDLRERQFRLAGSFEDIVDDAPDGLPPNVVNKLAVVFLDGNGFGVMRDSVAKRGFDPYRALCLRLEVNGGRLLVDLLRWLLCEGHPERWTTHRKDGEPRLRFETLLWGGDDMAFVLPAWAGWGFMGALQAALGRLMPPAGDGNRPTYKTGMVFAHHKTPIRELRRAAEALAYAAKAAADDENTVQVMALEGLDRAEMDPGEVRAAMFDAALAKDAGAFTLMGKDWKAITRAFERIEREIGRSQLHRWYARAEADWVLRRENKETDTKALTERMGAWKETCVKRLGAFPRAGTLEGPLFKETLLAHGAGRWPFLPLHHVLTLADYALAPKTAAAARDRAA